MSGIIIYKNINRDMTNEQLAALKKESVKGWITGELNAGRTVQDSQIQSKYDSIPAAGYATWTNEFSAEDIYETVKPYEPQTGPEMVDLGLSSGTLWAKVNIGAENEQDYGKYFAWGDAEGFTSSEVSGKFTDSWYAGRPGASLTGNISDADSDHNAAFAAYGSGYTMPSQADFNELINGTDKCWVTSSNAQEIFGHSVAGYIFAKTGELNTVDVNSTDDSEPTPLMTSAVTGATSPVPPGPGPGPEPPVPGGGKKVVLPLPEHYIFIPAAGYGSNGSILDVGDVGNCWGSTCGDSDFAYGLYFVSSGFIGVYSDLRCDGFSVRAIKRPTT